MAGRVVRNREPLSGIAVGMTSVDRTCGKYFSDLDSATDAQGRFVIGNVPADISFYLYSKMESLRSRGALPVRTISTRATGTTIDLGEIEVKPAFRVAGRVVLSDGKPVPPDTRLSLGRQQAWDHAEVILDAEGHFSFEGVAAESINLNTRLKGYKFSQKNPSLDWLNGGLIGTVDKDISDLVILLEPGTWRLNHEVDDLPAGAEQQPRNEPLRGIKL